MGNTPYANLHSYDSVLREKIEDNEPLGPNEIKLRLVLGSNHISRLFVIVEMYDRKSFGRGKRQYMKMFSKKERQVISRYYGKLYRWYLVKGIPAGGVTMSAGVYQTLIKAANFFATL